MTNAIIEAGTLYANEDTRVVSGLLLPYGEEGRSNLGRLTVDRGAVTIPADVSHLNANLDHNREQPVAAFVEAHDTPAGVWAAFRISRTPAGDELLADVRSDTPKRHKLSAEVANIVTRAGHVIGGALFGAAFLEAGAFPSAALMAAAADVGDAPAPHENTNTGRSTMTDNQQPAQPATPPAAPAQQPAPLMAGATPPAQPAAPAPAAPAAPAPVPLMAGAAVPSGMHPATPPAVQVVERKGNTLHQVAHALALFNQSGGDRRYLEALEASELDGSRTMFAALSDVTLTTVGGNILQPQWVGKVWQDQPVRQRFVPLMMPKVLTGATVKGWDWNQKPAGGDWAGDKTAVPSNAPTTVERFKAADRWSMGHDIDRQFVDFQVAEFWTAYYEAGAENFATWEDAKAYAALVAAGAANAINAAAAPGTWSGDTGTVQLVDGALYLIARNIAPEYAIVGADLYRDMLLQNDNKVIETLELQLGLEGGTLEGFRLVPALDATMDGKVTVGAVRAAGHYRLPGVPIRTTALDQVKAGVDEVAYGYAANMIHKPTAIVQVNAPA